MRAAVPRSGTAPDLLRPDSARDPFGTDGHGNTGGTPVTLNGPNLESVDCEKHARLQHAPDPQRCLIWSALSTPITLGFSRVPVHVTVHGAGPSRRHPRNAV